MHSEASTWCVAVTRTSPGSDSRLRHSCSPLSGVKCHSQPLSSRAQKYPKHFPDHVKQSPKKYQALPKTPTTPPQHSKIPSRVPNGATALACCGALSLCISTQRRWSSQEPAGTSGEYGRTAVRCWRLGDGTTCCINHGESPRSEDGLPRSRQGADF